MAPTRRTRRAVIPISSDLNKPQPSGILKSSDDTEFLSDTSSSDETSSFHELDPAELDEPLNYPFKPKESVWVRTQENNWCFGVVIGQGKLRPLTRNVHKQGTYYMVTFGGKSNIRKYFAPLNGEIKPDTRKTRLLLQAGGWIDIHSDDSS